MSGAIASRYAAPARLVCAFTGLGAVGVSLGACAVTAARGRCGVFCPNCGTQNPDAAQTCSKCNFHLKGVAAPKFKGTMLMMNPPVASPAAAPGGVAPPPRPAAPNIPSKLRGTMVGVAPMAGPSRGAPGPVAVPPAAMTSLGIGPTPVAPPPAAAGGLGYSALADVNPLGGTVSADGVNSGSGYGAPAPGGLSPVGSPAALAGTAIMPATGGAGGAGPFPSGAPRQGASGHYGPPPGGPHYGTAPQGPPPPNPPHAQGAGSPYGARGAPNYGAQGAFPGGSPYGGGPAGPYGAPPAGGPPPSYGAPQNDPEASGGPSYGSPPPPNPFIAPAAVGSSSHPGFGPSGGAPGRGAYGASSVLAGLGSASAGPSRRNPIMTLLLPLAVVFGGGIVGSFLSYLVSPVFGIVSGLASLAGSLWYLVLAIAMTNEVKAVTRNSNFAWWPILIPLYHFYWLWILVPQEVTKAKQILGVRTPTRSILLYVFLWPFAWASDLNDMVR